jgi:hypothetical protein
VDLTSPPMKPKNMVWIPSGSFLIGSNDFYPEAHHDQGEFLLIGRFQQEAPASSRSCAATSWSIPLLWPQDPLARKVGQKSSS